VALAGEATKDQIIAAHKVGGRFILTAVVLGEHLRKLKAAVSLGAVGKVIKDVATHSPKKPSDKCYNYKPNKHPDLIAASIS
jgi:hypothetical protein